VLVEVNCETDFVARTDDFQSLAKDVALPHRLDQSLAVSTDQVPKDWLSGSGRSTRPRWPRAEARGGRGKIVEGKIKKFFEERVLLEQAVREGRQAEGGNLVKALSQDGENIVVKRFVRWGTGRRGLVAAKLAYQRRSSSCPAKRSRRQGVRARFHGHRPAHRRDQGSARFGAPLGS